MTDIGQVPVENSYDERYEADGFQSLLAVLENESAALHTAGAWPERQLSEMSRADVLGWLVPAEFGGAEISPVELLTGYEKLAAACLTSVFVLTQRNAAIQRLVRSRNAELKSDLLSRLVEDSLFATVGISHLTTSRQHWKQPTVRVEEVDGGFILNGDVPWVTGADRADVVITGGTLSDGRQILIALRTASQGVAVQAPAPLLALNASRTASIQLTAVFVPVTDLVAGPVENVMQVAGGGPGSHTTSALAVGHSVAAVKLLQAEAEQRGELQSSSEQLGSEVRALRDALREATEFQSDRLPLHLAAETLRRKSNSLA
ncbi:MAG: acyl-CoA dehydrogenase family protein, partial [Planctomycetaceae bacterium]